MSRQRFILLDAGAARRPSGLPHVLVKADTADTEGRFSLLERRGHASDPAPEPHGGDEFVYVIAGELDIAFAGALHRLTPGMSAFLPGGAGHGPRVGADAPVHALHLWSPAADEPGRGRFRLLGNGEGRPGRIPLPPAFAVKVRTADTGGHYSLLDVVVAQDIPRHIHHKADEAIYVLGGELDVEYDGHVERAGPGRFVLLPSGVPHSLHPGSTPPPRVIQISAPGGWESYLEDMVEQRTRISTKGALDPAALNRIAGRYDITYEERPGVARS